MSNYIRHVSRGESIVSMASKDAIDYSHHKVCFDVPTGAFDQLTCTAGASGIRAVHSLCGKAGLTARLETVHHESSSETCFVPDAI